MRSKSGERDLDVKKIWIFLFDRANIVINKKQK